MASVDIGFIFKFTFLLFLNFFFLHKLPFSPNKSFSTTDVLSLRIRLDLRISAMKGILHFQDIQKWRLTIICYLLTYPG